jgi:hypothetical protein
MEQASNMKVSDSMIKRIIKRGLFCLACGLCLFIYCNLDDDDDDHHHHDPNEFQSTMLKQQRHKEYELRLFSGRTEPNNFAAGEAI